MPTEPVRTITRADLEGLIGDVFADQARPLVERIFAMVEQQHTKLDLMADALTLLEARLQRLEMHTYHLDSDGLN